MTSIGPLLGTFGFFAVLFLVGRYFQKKQKEKTEHSASTVAAYTHLRPSSEANMPLVKASGAAAGASGYPIESRHDRWN